MPGKRSTSVPPSDWEPIASSLAPALCIDLRKWFADHQRPLPWRNAAPHVVVPTGSSSSSSSQLLPPLVLLRDPYGTWVSEVMSQQTRIQTVVQYWQKWMVRFPTVADLAAASPDDVRAAWTGLGYYRRADLLHRGAKYVMDLCHGTIPRTRDELVNIPGIGAYSAAAIASICFGENCIGVDGNVMRVLARLGGVMNFDPKRPADAAEARKWAALLAESCRKEASSVPTKPAAGAPTREVRAPGYSSSVGEALIELGATVCRPVGGPDCPACPLQHVCRVRRMLSLGDIESIDGVIPLRGSKLANIGQETVTGVLHVHVHPTTGEISMILGKRKEGGLLSNMFEVPNRPSPRVARNGSTKGSPPAVAKTLCGDGHTPIALGQITHKFSHLHLTMHAYAVRHPSLASLNATVASACLRSLLHTAGGSNTELAVVNESNRNRFAISKLVDKVVALLRRASSRPVKDEATANNVEAERKQSVRKGTAEVKRAPVKRTRSGATRR